MQNYSYPSSAQVTVTGIGNPTGAAVPANAVYVAGENGSGNLIGLQVDASGFLKVSIAASALSPITTQDAADGPVTPGAVASKSILIGGQFNTALPTLTNTQQAALQLDASGRLILAPLTNASIVKAQLQDNSGAAIGLGQAAMVASLPVVIASNQSAIAISAASLPLPSGAATDATVANPQGSISGGAAGSKSDLIGGIFNTALPTITNGQQAALQLDSSARLIIAPLTNSSIVKSQLQDNSGNAINSTSNALNVSIQNASIAVTQSGNFTIQPLTNSSIVKAQLQDNNGAAITLGSKVSASSVPVVIASDQGAVSIVPPSSGTATLTNVGSSATSVTLLSSNASRKGAMIFNDSTAVLYVKFGTTASATSYTVQIASNGYYELPFAGFGLYTGNIDGIWASANGNARMTELT